MLFHTSLSSTQSSFQYIRSHRSNITSRHAKTRSLHTYATGLIHITSSIAKLFRVLEASFSRPHELSCRASVLNPIILNLSIMQYCLPVHFDWLAAILNLTNKHQQNNKKGFAPAARCLAVFECNLNYLKSILIARTILRKMQISIRRESRLAFDNPVLVRGIAAIFFVNR